jgi:hypothetical protein
LPKGDALKGRTIFLTDGDGGVHGLRDRRGRTPVHVEQVARDLTDDPFGALRAAVYKMLAVPELGRKGGSVQYHIAGNRVEGVLNRRREWQVGVLTRL